MNGQNQTIRGSGTVISEDHRHQIVVLFARMMRQYLTATTSSTEGTARTGREPEELLRTTSRP